jgi:hypothetical protein
MGLLPLDEYYKLREENIGGMSDSEDERKELAKIEKDLNKYKKKFSSSQFNERNNNHDKGRETV